MSRLADLARRVGVCTGVLPDPQEPEAGPLAPSDLARLVAAAALVVAFLVVGLVIAVLFTPVPLTDAVPWWVPFPVAVAVVAMMIGIDARRHR